MTAVTQALEMLDAAIAAASVEECAAIVVQLAARLAALGAGLAGSPARRWVSAELAAEVAAVDVADLRRWAARPGVTWASRPTRKTLLVDRDAFDRWLAAARFPHIAGVSRPKAAVSRSPSGTFAGVGTRSRPSRG